MRRAFLTAVMLICAISGFALDPEYLNPRLGLMIINNVVAGDIGAPSALVNTLGVSLNFPFKKNDLFSFDPGVDVYWTRYEWLDGRAHPTEAETAASALVLGAMLDAPVFVRWDMGERLQGMFGMGGSIVLRAAFRSSDAISASDVQSIGGWFYQKLRWFYPNAQLRLSYRLQEKFTFEFMTRGFLPLFNVLDPEAPSFMDHAMLNFTMGMRIKLL